MTQRRRMITSGSTHETLSALAQMPFLDSVELGAVAGLPERTARESLRRLHLHGCVGMVRHGRTDAFRVRRWYLTPTGIEELAKTLLRGEKSHALVAADDILSAQGRRSLVRRLDAVAVLYGLAQHVATAINAGYGLQFTWRWERQGVLDAVLQLPDGRTIAISRIGSTHAGDAVSYRLGRLRNLHRQGALWTTLLLVPGPVDLERAAVFMYDNDIERVFVATEPAMQSSSPDSRIWNSPSNDDYSLGEVLATAPVSKMPSTRRPKSRAMPTADILGDTDPLDLAATVLSVPARTLLRTLYDWPFASVSQLQRMTGLSKGHLGRVKGQLSGLGLIHHLRIGRTQRQRQRNETRLHISAAGHRYLARVDRSSEVIALKQWLVEPSEDGDKNFPIPDFAVTGTKSRTLLRERLHTEGVYDFMALLMSSCRASRFWKLAQILPAHRWERRYKHGTRRSTRFRDISHAIRPDATFILRHPDRPSASFVLEFERRARSPSTMRPKIERYRNYFASKDTESDFIDGGPTVLFVFETSEYASGFARFAATDGGSQLPLLVSSLDELEKAGSVFRSCWLMPWRLNDGYVPFSSLATPAWSTTTILAALRQLLWPLRVGCDCRFPV